jgi:hypothetical protein
LRTCRNYLRAAQSKGQRCAADSLPPRKGECRAITIGEARKHHGEGPAPRRANDGSHRPRRENVRILRVKTPGGPVGGGTSEAYGSGERARVENDAEISKQPVASGKIVC